eukprot:1654427-Pyramimonas_sp.AAC.1
MPDTCLLRAPPPTRKGGENLRRIQKGLFPSYRGPPVSVTAAQTDDAVRCSLPACGPLVEASPTRGSEAEGRESDHVLIDEYLRVASRRHPSDTAATMRYDEAPRAAAAGPPAAAAALRE